MTDTPEEPEKPKRHDSRTIESGDRCECCLAPFPARHGHRICSTCEAQDEAEVDQTQHFGKKWRKRKYS